LGAGGGYLVEPSRGLRDRRTGGYKSPILLLGVIIYIVFFGWEAGRGRVMCNVIVVIVYVSIGVMVRWTRLVRMGSCETDARWSGPVRKPSFLRN
jgi:hypothetical protein